MKKQVEKVLKKTEKSVKNAVKKTEKSVKKAGRKTEKSVKKAGKKIRKMGSGKGNMTDLIRIVLSLIIPPVGVFFKEGLGLQFWINIILTLLGYIPGLIHAIWIIVVRK